MPFDNLTAARPYMREMTTALVALVATAPSDDVLRAIAAELAFRSRPAARKLLDEVTARLSSRVAPVALPSIIIPCAHGEVIPEMREEVVSVTRVTAPESPAKIARPPARKAKAPVAEPAPDRAPLFRAVAIDGTPISIDVMEAAAKRLRATENRMRGIERRGPARWASEREGQWAEWKRASDPTWNGYIPPHAKMVENVDKWWADRGGPICAA